MTIRYQVSITVEFRADTGLDCDSFAAKLGSAIYTNTDDRPNFSTELILAGIADCVGAVALTMGVTSMVYLDSPVVGVSVKVGDFQPESDKQGDCA